MTNPNGPIPPRHLSSKITPFLLIAIATAVSGCIGGAEHRLPDPAGNDGAVAVERTHWIFPLYHYQEKEGRKTFTPLFLVPIPVGRTDTALVEADRLTTDDAESLTTRIPASIDGRDTPAWSTDRGDEERSIRLTLDGGSPTPPARPNATPAEPTIEPGVWAASVPPVPVAVRNGVRDASGRSHQVRPGDTLYALATRYYGSGREWRRIADANRDRLPAPERLAVGTRLRIP